ncbi:MAG: N-acetylglucosamine kinase [Dehalococcoidia bacterium]
MLLALDGGGTKTICLIAGADGRVHGWGRGGPSNLSFVTREAAGNAIELAVSEAILMVEQSTKHSNIDLAICGGPVLPEVLRTVVQRIARPAALQTVAEAPCCLAAADGAAYGAVVLAGTGCFEYARAADGRTHRTDGWGTLLGDEGSAYDIACMMLAAIARAEDGRGPRTSLREAVLEFYGVDTVRAVARRIYGEDIPRHEIARLAAIAGLHAGRDNVARALLRAAALKLASGVLTCIRAVGLEQESFDLVLCGGVFRAGEAIIVPLVEAVRAAAQGVRPVRPRYEPVYGALRLAFSAAATPWSESVAAAFEQSLHATGAAPWAVSA